MTETGFTYPQIYVVRVSQCKLEVALVDTTVLVNKIERGVETAG
jgi:hypothetical protein